MKAAEHVAATVLAALQAEYHMDNASPCEDDPLRFGVCWPDGAFVEVRVVEKGNTP